MGLQRYIFGSLVLMGLVGFYVHKMVTQDDFALEVFGIHITLPIAVWIVVPMAILFIASFFHISYYGIKNYFRKKRVTRDIDKLADALYWGILKEPKKHHYFDKRIKKIGAALDVGCDAILKADKSKCHDRIRDALDMAGGIKHGEFVDLKKINLDKSNPYEIQNWLNFLKAEPNRAEEILRKSESYDPKVVNESIRVFVESANEHQLEKYAHLIDNDVMMYILDIMKKRDDKDRISLELIDKLLMQKNFADCDYLLLARKLSKLYTPHALLSFFEKLVSRDERSFKAYIFILIEFEMLDRANELLEDTQPNEYLDFKAFLDLRKAGKHYPIDLLLQQC